MATEVVLGDNGKPVIVQASPLDRYRIGILQFSVTETQYDEQTLAQFAAKKESYLKAEQAKAQRQEEYQQRLMVTEKGLRQVAEIKAEENQKKERALIQATQAAEVAVITKTQAVTAAEQKVEVAAKAQAEAETLKKIAQIKADTAEIDKKATIIGRRGQAERDRIGRRPGGERPHLGHDQGRPGREGRRGPGRDQGAGRRDLSAAMARRQGREPDRDLDEPLAAAGDRRSAGRGRGLNVPTNRSSNSSWML